MDQDYLKSIMSYSPETGVFTWATRRKGTKGIGSIAGVVLNSGYRQIMIDGKHHLEHRLAFLWMTGGFPKKHIDHINGSRSDNRWNNLREASPGENQQNRAMMKNNTSGFTGVSWSNREGRWQASIQVDRNPKHLGLFDTAEVAAEAYIAAKSRLHTFQPTIREDGL